MQACLYSISQKTVLMVRGSQCQTSYDTQTIHCDIEDHYQLRIGVWGMGFKFSSESDEAKMGIRE